MTDVIANFVINLYTSKAIITLFLDINCFLIASSVSVNSLRQILLSVLADGNTNSLCNALYEHRS